MSACIDTTNQLGAPPVKSPGTPPGALSKSQKKRAKRRQKKGHSPPPALPAAAPPAGPAQDEHAAFEAAIAASQKLMESVSADQTGEAQVATAMKALELARGRVRRPDDRISVSRPMTMHIQSPSRWLKYCHAGTLCLCHLRTDFLGGRREAALEDALTNALIAQVTGVLKAQGGDEGVMNALQNARAKATRERLAADQREKLSATLREKLRR